MQKIQFEYFKGMEAEQYTFYRIPKVLFTAECFKSLSCEAKVLYGLMLDRMSLSIKNRWFDREDRVYIIFTIDDVMELMNCSRQKAIKNLAELDTEKGIGLVEKKRLGLGKPNVIYVKNFMIQETSKPEADETDGRNGVNTKKYENQTSGSMKRELQEVPKSDFRKYENQTSGSMKNEFQEVPESYFQKCEKQTSGSMKRELQEVPKSNSNDTDINNTECNNIDLSKTNDNEIEIIKSNLINTSNKEMASAMDVMDQMAAYRETIRENISYACFQDLPGPGSAIREVDELVEVMVEVMLCPNSGKIRIAGQDRPVPVVKSRFMALTHSHIEYVLFCLHRNTTKVGNIKAYLLTTLYNATMTMDHFYQAEVMHDMHGGG